MKKEKLRSKILAFVMPGLVLLFTACNNSDYTKSQANKENGSANNDTANVSGDTSMQKQTTATPKKKGRASVGTMAENKTMKIKPDKNGVYDMTDVSPVYPGGQPALEDYVNNNIEYQEPAIGNNTEGTVNIQFIVDENGNVNDAKVIGKALGDGLDEEAVRVISRMPKWTPGKVKGKNVKARIILPITYKIEE